MTTDTTYMRVSWMFCLLNCVWGVYIVYCGCIVSRVTLMSKELLLLLTFLDYKKFMEAFQILGG